jgi:ribosomal protein L37AE/L43A
MYIAQCCGRSYGVNEGQWVTCEHCGAEITHKPLKEKTASGSKVPCSDGVRGVDDKWKKISCPSCEAELNYRDLSDGWYCKSCDKFFGYEMVIEGEPCNYGQNP